MFSGKEYLMYSLKNVVEKTALSMYQDQAKLNQSLQPTPHVVQVETVNGKIVGKIKCGHCHPYSKALTVNGRWEGQANELDQWHMSNWKRHLYYMHGKKLIN